jgi:hypothetical protein
MDGLYTTDYFDMPESAHFDELITAEGFNDYVERHGLWKVIFNNGVYYTQDWQNDDAEVGIKCGVLQVLDKNCL